MLSQIRSTLGRSTMLHRCSFQTQHQFSTSAALTNTGSSSGNVSKFAKAISKMEGHENFQRSIRFSPLTQMGDPQGKIVQGSIVHIVDDDLYIDFGSKFNCVCPRPQKNSSAYALGTKVRVMIHDLELSTRFLGAATDLTILEADCSLLGLSKDVQTPT